MNKTLQNIVITDTEFNLLVEARKKSGVMAAFLNILMPGAGFMYCGRWILGVFVAIVFYGVLIASVISGVPFGAIARALGIIGFVIGYQIIFFVDGFLTAKSYNKRLVEKMINERARLPSEIIAQSKDDDERGRLTFNRTIPIAAVFLIACGGIALVMSLDRNEQKFWDQPTKLQGIFDKGSFTNCCFKGEETQDTFYDLSLKNGIDVLGTGNDRIENIKNVTHVQIGATKEMVYGLHDGDDVVVECQSLWQGNTGHYALPVYCNATSVKRSVH
jgi:hypothetical protein